MYALYYSDRKVKDTKEKHNTNFSFRLYVFDKFLFKLNTGHTTSKSPFQANTVGGHLAYAEGLKQLNVKDPGDNQDKFKKWAGSVSSFPVVIKQKVLQHCQ